jgi:hypothetical protein
LEREPGLADPSGWWRLNIAEEGFLAAKHPRARLVAAVELVHYRQTGRFLKATDDLPAGVAGQLADATGTAGRRSGWLAVVRPNLAAAPRGNPRIPGCVASNSA